MFKTVYWGALSRGASAYPPPPNCLLWGAVRKAKAKVQQRLSEVCPVPSQPGIAGIIGPPFLLLPSTAENFPTKERTKERAKERYILKGARSVLLTLAVLPLLLLRGSPRVTIRPTLVLPKNRNTSSVVLSSQNSLTERAPGASTCRPFLSPPTPYRAGGATPCTARRGGGATVAHRCHTTSTRRCRSCESCR